MAEKDETEKRLAAKARAQRTWANTEDRAARTANGRKAAEQKFLDAAGGDPVRAKHLRLAHMYDMSLKSLQARRRKKEGNR